MSLNCEVRARDRRIADLERHVADLAASEPAGDDADPPAPVET